MTPKSNGLVELAGGKAKERGFFCMELARRLTADSLLEWEGWHGAMEAAKSGSCPYRDTCRIYERTMKGRSRQLTLF